MSGYGTRSNAIMNAFKTAAIAPSMKTQGFTDARSEVDSRGLAEAKAAEAILNMRNLDLKNKGIQRSNSMTADDIYKNLGGKYNPSVSAGMDEASPSEYLDAGQLQGGPASPSLMNQARTLRGNYTLGQGTGGNVSQVADALKAGQSVGAFNDMSSGRVDPSAIARVMGALGGKDTMKMDQGIPYDPYGSAESQPAGSDPTAGYDAMYGRGAWRSLPDDAKIAFSQMLREDPNVASHAQQFINYLNTPGTKALSDAAMKNPMAYMEALRQGRNPDGSYNFAKSAQIMAKMVNELGNAYRGTGVQKRVDPQSNDILGIR